MNIMPSKLSAQTTQKPAQRHPNLFRFYTERRLVEFAGVTASSLPELLYGLRTVGGASIFYHTHHSWLQRHFVPPLYRNDFATWVAEALGEDALAERLGSINIMDCSTIRELRETMASTVAAYLGEKNGRPLRTADTEDEFHFLRSKSFVFFTGRTASTLEEFAEHLTQVTRESLFYHVFVTRLNPAFSDRQFHTWLAEELKRPGVAAKIRMIDPYLLNLEDLRNAIVSVVAEAIGREETLDERANNA